MSDQTNVVHVNFTPGKHGQGPARCLGCRHEWQAVVALGTTEIDCPACGNWKGVLLGNYAPKVALACQCGCTLFYLTESGTLCPNCGLSDDDFGGAG